MGDLRINCLGGLFVTRAGRDVDGFHSAKAKALLVYLAVTGCTHSRMALADLLWPELTEKSARANLRKVLSNLRSIVGDGVRISRDAVGTNMDLLDSDVAELEALLDAADTPRLERAVDLYRGDFLHGFHVPGVPSFEAWSLGERTRLREVAVGAAERLVGQLAAAGRLMKAIHTARCLLTIEPWHEEAHRQLMHLLVRSGQRSAALKQYEACRLMLERELGVAPTEATAELYRAILDDRAAVVPEELERLRTTSFLGRQRELGEIGKLLTRPECRLLTVTGVGGVGKTRLALQAARQLHAEAGFVDGVAYVPFETVSDVGSIPAVVAGVLDLTPSGREDVRSVVRRFLAGKQLLLVLDNFEHLLEGTPFLREWIESSPGLKLLVTSRERLNLGAEWVFALEGLAWPEAATTVEGAESFDAVELFVQRARQTRHGFALTSETLPAVLRICELVEGMPLAIELASSWLHVLSPSGISERLEEGLDLLEGSTRDVPARHRSIRKVFDDSWEFLSEVERKVLGRLSVFRGGFGLEAAEVVAGASLPVLASLGNKSLVTLSPTGRYRQHPLLLEHARERFSERPEERTDVEEKHGLYYVSFLEEHYRGLSSSRIDEVRELLSAELPNILAAWGWAVDHLEVDLLKRAAFPLYLVFDVEEREVEIRHLYSEAVDRLDASNAEHRAALGYTLIGQDSDVPGGVALLHPLGEDLGLAWGLSKLLISRIVAGDAPRARAYLREGLPIARRVGNSYLLGRFLGHGTMLASPEASGSRIEDARRLHEQTLEELRVLGDPYYLTWETAMYGTFLVRNRFVEEGEAVLYEGLELAREYRFRFPHVAALEGLAEAALASGDLDAAEAFAVERIRVWKYPESFVAHVSLVLLGVVALRRGDVSEAEGFLLEALRIRFAGKTENLYLILAALGHLAQVRIARGDLVVAVEWLGFIVHHRAEGRAGAIWRPPVELDEAQRSLDDLRGRLPPEEFAAAVARGRGRALDDIMREILAEPADQVHRSGAVEKAFE